jgi:drug/metabolite transporter (DMT)-like permease
MALSQRRALVFLGLGTMLFALGPAVIKLLTLMGGTFGVRHPGAVSFCNVLFVGNFCAGLVTLAVYRPRRIFGELARLPRRTVGLLLVAAVVSAAYPAFLFNALERTSVINVVLLSRFNGIVFVAFAFFFVHATVRKSEAVGYAVMAAGVLLLLVVNNGGASLSTGEALVLISTVFFALTEFISKSVLRQCSVQTYVFFRNLVSAVIFFVVGSFLFGIWHFADAFVGELWILMIVYAGVAVVAAQLFWLRATPVLPAQTIANGQLLNPAFSLLFAYLLLSEVPTLAQWSVMGVILVGMLIPKLVDWEQSHRKPGPAFGAGLAGTH